METISGEGVTKDSRYSELATMEKILPWDTKPFNRSQINDATYSLTRLAPTRKIFL